MKTVRSFFIYNFFLLSSCVSGPETSSETNGAATELNQVSTQFEEYLKTLDKIPLPLSYNALGKLPTLSVNFDKSGFTQYNYHGTSRPLGILFDEGKVVTLVDCSNGDWGLVPFLTTYDQNGNKIDSLGPYKRSGEDMGYRSIEYVTISSDKIVTVIDSTTTYSLKPDGSDVEDASRRLVVGTTKYKIAQDGHFKEIR